MSSPSVGKRRTDTDVMKLIGSKHEVTILNGLDEFLVKFFGPLGTPYEGGVWKVRVRLPEDYPFKSPLIGFVNKIYHPNIDKDGLVCLDVLSNTWTALFDLSNVFENFLPQLLTYPNPLDPLNSDAAELYMRKPDGYKKKVEEYVRKYASEEEQWSDDTSSCSESTMSEHSEVDVEDIPLLKVHHAVTRNI